MPHPVPPFHLAFPVDDLAAARAFYVDVLGCRVGRSSDAWIDFDLCGHQIVAHLVAPAGGQGGRAGSDSAGAAEVPTSRVDRHDVPVRHFGLVLDWDQWHAWAERLEQAGIAFLIAPGVRFAGEVGEQATFFVRDPAGNALEFKAFRDPAALFASDPPRGQESA